MEEQDNRCELTTNQQKRSAADKLEDSVRESLPAGLSRPALRALAGAGIRTLEQLTEFTEDELLDLHGMGPKGVRTIRAALAERGEALRE